MCVSKRNTRQHYGCSRLQGNSGFSVSDRQWAETTAQSPSGEDPPTISPDVLKRAINEGRFRGHRKQQTRGRFPGQEAGSNEESVLSPGARTLELPAQRLSVACVVLLQRINKDKGQFMGKQ